MNNGKQGEQLFRQVMEEQGYMVEDVSNNSAYWSKDIDFIITSPTTGLVKSFEVKWDGKIGSTGNLYLELANKNSEGLRGWYEFCKADYLAYGDAETGVFYMFDLEALRQAVKKKPKEVASCGKDSIGYLVNLASLKGLYETITI